ncbi:MAG: hypothetical protein ACRD6W_13805 [Nitrososphaerales archaeon]
MKTFIQKTALTSIAVLFLLGGANAAFASTSQTLSTTMVGGVSSLGSQTYTVAGGQTAFAMIAGQTINPNTANLQYNLIVEQYGLNTIGYAYLSFSGTTTGGVNVAVNGRFSVNSMVPAAELPLGCSRNCQSALPFFFLGTSSNVQVTVAGQTQTVPETLQIESPYFNPWGAPIVLASEDNSIVIAATYTRGSIVWTGTQDGGDMFGTLGTTQVSGAFNMTSTEFENLVTGNANDMGTISFSSMTPSSLNNRGFYSGTSTIPTTGTSDCSASTGIPGTCTETGFQSIGQFTMNGISGSYDTTWGVPALGFSSTVSATVGQSWNSGQH